MKTETQIRQEIEALRSLTTAQLKQKYREVFGEESRSNHKQFLFRRIAWRIQANAWGGLSERARQRALEIADDADLRIRAPKDFLREPLEDGRTMETRLKPSLDPRLPLPGTPGLASGYRYVAEPAWLTRVPCRASGRSSAGWQ
jgi:hypothetical protein